MARRADDAVVGHGVVVRVVEMLLPLINFPGPRFDRLRPTLALLYVGDPKWGKHTHDFVQRYTTEILSNNQVDQVVDVRETLARPLLHGNVAVQPERPDVLPARLDVRCVGIQALKEEPVVRPQCGRQLAIATAKVDDHATRYSGGFQDLLGQLTCVPLL